MECPICLGETPFPIRLPCGHKFCENCIQQWHQKQKDCPVCRAPVVDLEQVEIKSQDKCKWFHCLIGCFCR
jgi:hypothetical protein